MNEFIPRRAATKAALTVGSALATTLLAGCAGPLHGGTSADPGKEAPYCVLDNRGRVRVCTTVPAPSAARDEQAKRFVADPAALTVYVVRQSWGDTRDLLRLSLDGRAATIETTPSSLVRLRLAPGEHTLSFDDGGRRHGTQLEGAAGELRFVWIRREPWSFGRELLWGTEPEAQTRERAKLTRLVADISTR